MDEFWHKAHTIAPTPVSEEDIMPSLDLAQISVWSAHAGLALIAFYVSAVIALRYWQK